LAFFIVNTGLVSIAVGLEQHISPFRVWYEKYSFTLNTQIAGGSLVILLGILRQSFGTQVLFLLLPFAIMSYHFHQPYFQQPAPPRARAAGRRPRAGCPSRPRPRPASPPRAAARGPRRSRRRNLPAACFDG